MICIAHVEWRGLNEDLPKIKDWPRNLTCPSAGEVRWCGVWENYGPVKVEVGAAVWLLWQSWNALFNGYSECPPDLDTSALVESKIINISQVKLKKVSSLKFLRVECLKIVRLSQIPEFFPRSPPLSAAQTRGKTTICAETSTLVYKQSDGQAFDWQIELKSDKTLEKSGFLLLCGFSLHDWATIKNSELL